MNNEDLIILYEDNHIIVVLKPQNIPSCEDESMDKDLLTMVKEYIKVKYDKPGNVFLGLVHRLDRPTGGIMVFAKNSKSAARLSEQMKNGDFDKKYLTVLVGEPRDEEGRLVNYLKKNPANNIVYVVPSPTTETKRAELRYEVLEKKDGLSLTKVVLLTGRSHQIRVQLSHLGYPVYGDKKYGGENAKKGNLALWAYELSFTHPVTKERLLFRVEPPKDVAPWDKFNTEKCMLFY